MEVKMKKKMKRYEKEEVHPNERYERYIYTIHSLGLSYSPFDTHSPVALHRSSSSFSAMAS